MGEVALKVNRSKNSAGLELEGRRILSVVRADPQMEYWRAEEKYNCLISNFEWFMRYEGMPNDREDELIKIRIDQN
jgi:hypothetical protein